LQSVLVYPQGLYLGCLSSLTPSATPFCRNKYYIRASNALSHIALLSESLDSIKFMLVLTWRGKLQIANFDQTRLIKMVKICYLRTIFGKSELFYSVIIAEYDKL